jgi:hypothetical protein
MKVRILLSMLLCSAWSAFAQAPVVPIMDIQYHAGHNNCVDSPNPLYFNPQNPVQVTIRGVAIVRGGQAISTTSGNRWIWVRDINATPSTPYGNINVRLGQMGPTQPDDILNIVEGDTVEITGVIQEFSNAETQLVPNIDGVRIIGNDVGPAPAPLLISVGELNGALNVNNRPLDRVATGEKYEGNFVEIQNVTVTNVASANGRVRITVRDNDNNHVVIYDRFLASRPENGLVPPNVGDVYLSIKGIVEHSKTNPDCPNGADNGWGYNINPFDPSHYVKGASAPAIGNLARSVVCPGNTQAVTVSANIIDDQSVAQAQLFYAVGESNTTYTPLNMTASGNVYSAEIPAAANGAMVKYYIRARDNENNVVNFPSVPSGADPIFYFVSNTGCTIRDMQYTPYSNGRSGYENQIVTIEGVVTASNQPNNLGYVYIQQEGINEWAGISLFPSPLLNNVEVGQKIRVTGRIRESFGFTRVEEISAVETIGSGTITPVTLSPTTIASYSFAVNEKYEGMLVRIANPTQGADLFVIDTNADAGTGNNFGDYRVGVDVDDPNTGTRVLAGRQTGTTFSSLNVSYINNIRWATQDGNMVATPIVVAIGDKMKSLTGIVYYGFNNLRLLPRNNADFEDFFTINIESLINTGRLLTVYPNPATSTVRIAQDGKPVEQALVKIYSVAGKLVHQAQVNGDGLNVSALKKGIYFAEVSTSNTPTQRVKLIIQ